MHASNHERKNRTGKFFIAPADAPRDPYPAGYDGNAFDSYEEARAAIPEVAACFGTDPSDWVVSEY